MSWKRLFALACGQTEVTQFVGVNFIDHLLEIIPEHSAFYGCSGAFSGGVWRETFASYVVLEKVARS
jgi:hypothetical protein